MSDRRRPPRNRRLQGVGRVWDDSYHRLFEESLDAIIVGTIAGQLLDINNAAIRLLGYESKEEMLALDISTELYWDPEERRRIQLELAVKRVLPQTEVGLRTRSGKRLSAIESAAAIFDDRGELVGSRSIFRDITDLRQLEERLRRSLKTEALGRLVEGVAHDFNNLLTAINGYSELILLQTPEDNPARSAVSEIREAGRRATGLTRRLLTLSRHQAVLPRRLDLNRVTGDMGRFLGRVLGEDIRLTLKTEPSLPDVLADQGDVEQIILNLAIYVREAMVKGGDLTIETASAVRESVEPNPAVSLTLSHPVVEGLRETQRLNSETSLVEKDRGHGSQSDLVIVHRLVRTCGGSLEVETTPSSVRFLRLFFPLAETAPLTSSSDTSRADKMPKGNETVMLVEDEAAVRELVQRILERLGYRVLPAKSAEAALNICADLVRRPDLLLTDVVMPETSGPDLAEDLQSRYPDLRVLFMSGYTDSLSGVRSLNERRTAFLPKPFSPETLAQKVREVLDASP